ncbi:MFS transporter [Emcibacter sp. SYSU 3D8]|uniref:MFS transporter n=1 Tax=Emcibacter sp. SYSU 3D8 TaxID=3133969 RepID=UPI0031FF462E
MRWYYGWNVLAVAIVFQALMVGIVFYGFTVWGTPWITEFDTGAEMIMRANAGATLATGALMLYAGRLMDRFSMRWIIIGGTLLLAAGMVLVAYATSMWQIITLYTTLIACGYAFSTTLAGQVLAARWFPSRVGFAVGISLLGSSFGGIVMPPLLAWLLKNYGWRDANLMLAALVVILVVPLVWFIVRMPREGETRVADTAQTAQGTAAGEAPWGFFEVLREPTFWIIGLACLGTTLASYSFLTSIGPYAHDLGIDPQRMSLLIPILAVAGIVGRLALGWMADKVDARIPYWIATAVIWGTLLLTLGEPSYRQLMLISGLIGLGAGGLLPVCCVMVGQKFGARSFSRVMGMATPFFSISAAAGPWISAKIRDSLGSYTGTFHFEIAGLPLSVTAFGIYLWVLPLAAALMYFLHKSAMTRTAAIALPRRAAA